MPPFWRATRCCFVPPPRCWKSCTARHPRAAEVSCAPTPTPDYCASTRSGIFPADDKAADLLYEVINRRYERKPLIVTTNRAFKEWNQVFPNATCIVTMLDRLLHHADVTVIEGQSYRMRESEQETAARRSKK